MISLLSNRKVVVLLAGKKKNFRQGDAEKASKPSRRLEIRLPADHFIFEVKEGSRSKVAVELLDLAKRLERIEERLAALESAGIRSPGPKDSEKKGFDAAGFFAAFD